MGVYRVAQVCLNGHAITDAADAHPELRAKHCSKCGAETTMACEKCSADIRGDYHFPGVFAVGEEYVAPRFCHACGRAYPWTEAKLRTAAELIEELDELSAEEKSKLKSSVDELARDAPSKEVAALRIKKTFLKLGKGGADSLRQLLVDVLCPSGEHA